MVREFQFGKKKEVLEMDGGDRYPIKCQMCLMPPNYRHLNMAMMIFLYDVDFTISKKHFF